MTMRLLSCAITLAAAMPLLSCASGPLAGIATAVERIVAAEGEPFSGLTALPAPSAWMLASEKRGLLWVDVAGRELGRHVGSYEGLDARPRAGGAVLVSVDQTNDQAVLFELSGSRLREALRLPSRGLEVEAACLYGEGGDLYAFTLDDTALARQWLVADSAGWLPQPREVRTLALPPGVTACSVDDARAQLYVTEPGIGVWAYAAGAESEETRTLLDLEAPRGGLRQRVTALGAFAGGVAVAEADGRVALYASERLQTLDSGRQEPLALATRADGATLQLALLDGSGLYTAKLSGPAMKLPAPLAVVRPRAETAPVASAGDAADDPAIWVHPTRPQDSRVLGTNKKRGLDVYDLSGRRLQELKLGLVNNVDLRQGIRIGGALVDIAAASEREHNRVELFRIDRASGNVTRAGSIASGLPEIYGLCMYRAADGSAQVFANDKDGRYRQFRLRAEGSRLSGELLREFAIGGQPEGCIADEQGRRLYFGEEDAGIWTIGAEASASSTPQRIKSVGAELQADVEGIALYRGARQAYLVVSSQGNDSYVVYDAAAPWALRGAFRIGPDGRSGIDGASETDGLEVTSANLGGAWKAGMLVVQDGRNRMPPAPQNFKYVPWSDIAAALKLE